MGQDTRLTVEVPVTGNGYDELVANAHRAAEALLGTTRDYWLDLRSGAPHVIALDNTILSWEATAVIVYPADPPF